MGSRGAAATLSQHLMLVATLSLAAATFMSTAEAGCSSSMAQQLVNSTSRGFRVPEGGEDGIYMGSVEVDEQGVEQYRVKFLGKGNTTLHGRWANNNVNVSRPGGLGRKLLQQNSGVHCQLAYLDPIEVFNAHAKVASYFGPGGALVPAQTTWFAVDGCTVAYFCNYNVVGFMTTSGRIWIDALAINTACGAATGGYYAREYTANIASGRTFIGDTVCQGF